MKGLRVMSDEFMDLNTRILSVLYGFTPRNTSGTGVHAVSCSILEVYLGKLLMPFIWILC